MSDPVTFSFRNEIDAPTVNLYSHWGSRDAFNTLANAIEKARPRFNDPEYATRIVVSAILRDSIDSETGFGLYASNDEFNEFETILVDWARSTVTFADPRELDDTHVVTVAFDEFIELAPELVI